ncbi:hypothetical protein HPB47_009069, partial [Ixodes persulcatus]
VKKHHQLEDEGRLLPAPRGGQVVRLRDSSQILQRRHGRWLSSAAESSAPVENGGKLPTRIIGK